MAPFAFQCVQSLEISKTDNPQVKLSDNLLTITADRGGERIIITAPIDPSLLRVAQTTVKTPKKGAPLKGRRLPTTDPRVGSSNKLAKLTEDQVKEIRKTAADEELLESFGNLSNLSLYLSNHYGVHHTTIMNIIRNRCWKHV